MDQILSDEKNLQSSSGRCDVVRDKNQEWGTSGVSDWATSIPVVCQRPPKFHRGDNVAFHQRRQMVLPRSQSHLLQGSHYDFWNSSVNWDFPVNTTKCNLIAIGWAPPIQFLLTLHPLQRGCLQIQADAAYDKAIIC